MTEQKTSLDFEALRRAAEHNDAEALAGLYAEDAEVLVVNRETRPAHRTCCAAGKLSLST